MKLTLQVMSQLRLAVLRLPASHPIPEWILSAMGASNNGSFLSITQTREELSLVCPEDIIPETFLSTTTTGNDAPKVESDWIAFQVCGPLDFAWTGILAGLAQPLAAAGISIFAISTYDTDYVLVKQDKVDPTTKVWRDLGHTVVDEKHASKEA